MLLDAIVQGIGFCLGFTIAGVFVITIIAIIGMIIQEFEE